MTNLKTQQFGWFTKEPKLPYKVNQWITKQFNYSKTFLIPHSKEYNVGAARRANGSTFHLSTILTILSTVSFDTGTNVNKFVKPGLHCK